MTRKNLLAWIAYWDRASMGPVISNVVTREDLDMCRKFNRCMCEGVMWDVTNDQMWEALCEYRAVNG